MTDFDTAFAEATTEVEAGGGEDAGASTQKQNAVIHLGDGEVIDPQADEVGDEDEGDEGQEDTELDESEDDEADDDSESDPLRFDLESHADELVTVKINGKEMSVPLKEAVNGFMRQEDYTRKTQEISELRKAAEWGIQMRDALLTDPQGLINGLAEAMNVTVPQAGPVDDPYQTDDPELAPIMAKLKQLEADNAELKRANDLQQQERIQKEVWSEHEAVAAKYDDYADNSKEVLQLAAQKQLGIEEAYLLWSARNGATQKRAQAEQTQKVKTVAEKEQAKRKLAKTVTSGSGRNTPDTTPVIQGDSFADMFTYALSEGKKK